MWRLAESCLGSTTLMLDINVDLMKLLVEDRGVDLQALMEYDEEHLSGTAWMVVGAG